jgi:predicted phage baseplate assembly protein
VRLPEISLDDRRFQDLVNEAREKVAQKCPEWSEHNVSDPGITLIELFAWMTETIIYRLNRIPEKLHIALLDLLGIRLDPPSAASADLLFRLVATAAEPTEIKAGTEVGTVRTAAEQAIIFQTTEGFVIPPARPVAYLVQRGQTVKDVGVAKGEAHPKGADQLPFGTPPRVGDALYLGFDEPLGRLLMQVDVDCSQARGAGVVPEDPPLLWEVYDGEDWVQTNVHRDVTGGFNYGSGVIELQLPPVHAQTGVGGVRAYWLRCRVSATTRSGGVATEFTHPPEIYSITAAPIGALLPASHATRHELEELGVSDGTPGQTFALSYAPVLPPLPAETLDVRNPGTSMWESWERRDSFADSGPEDRHFVLDAARGAVELGPALRLPNGVWRRYGAVPPGGAQLRFTSYREGGGRLGNVAPNTLTVLKHAIPRVASVQNPAAARGGVDPESLESARQHAALEIRTRYRAVTAEDYEFLAREASPRVARARCLPSPEGYGAVRVHLVPAVEPADAKLDYEALLPDESLIREVTAYLDTRRMIGTRVELLPANLRGVSVVINLQASARANLRRIEEEVEYALYTYLNPLVGGSAKGPAGGWEFGRMLNQGELFGIAHSIDGVEFVKILRVYETDLATGKQESKPAGTHLMLEPNELIASGTHVVKAEYGEE